MPVLQSALQHGIISDIVTERNRQDQKWGVPSHPSVGPMPRGGYDAIPVVASELGIPTADRARRLLQEAMMDHGGNWAAILVEELAEAVEQATLEALGNKASRAELRKELVQVAAVTVAWIEDLDRKEVSNVKVA